MAIQISPNGRLMTIQTNDSSYQMLADKKWSASSFILWKQYWCRGLI